MPFETCRKCPHKNHDGKICQYPKSVFRTAGVPIDRCGCMYRVRLEKVFKGRSFKVDHVHPGTKSGERLVNTKPCLD